jgi:hypothetical protein
VKVLGLPVRLLRQINEAVLDSAGGAEHAHGLLLRRVAFVYAVHSFPDQLLGELRAGGFVFDQDVPGCHSCGLWVACNTQGGKWPSMHCSFWLFRHFFSTHTVCYHHREVESTAYRRSNLWNIHERSVSCGG